MKVRKYSSMYFVQQFNVGSCYRAFRNSRSKSRDRNRDQRRKGGDEHWRPNKDRGKRLRCCLFKSNAKAENYLEQFRSRISF